MSEMTNITTEASDSPVSNKTVLRLDDVRESCPGRHAGR